MLLSCLRTFRSTCAQCQTGERSWPVGNVASTLCAMIAWMSTLPNVVAHQTRSAVRVVTTIWRPSCDLNPHGGVLTNFVGRMIGNLGPRAALYARKCIFWRNNCTRGGGFVWYCLLAGSVYWNFRYWRVSATVRLYSEKNMTSWWRIYYEFSSFPDHKKLKLSRGYVVSDDVIIDEVWYFFSFVRTKGVIHSNIRDNQRLK